LGVRAAVVRDWFVDTISISDEYRRGITTLAEARSSPIDPVVVYLVGATNGIMYQHLIGTLREYPIPDLPMPQGHGELLLDVGCSWGRWSIAASRRGYEAVGIDPSLGAVLAASRVARALGARAHFVVGDARFLPFRRDTLDRVYSFSVIQHMSEANAVSAAREMARVLKPGGSSVVQMPTKYGIRCLYHQARRGFREGRGFEVRYRTAGHLKRLFGGAIGPTDTSVHCYFGIGLQTTDAPLMPASGQIVLAASEALRRLSRWIRPLAWAADSLYVRSVKPG
jgi:ubiquinone/menaquinone biosynthesis C-methylase UbiE